MTDPVLPHAPGSDGRCVLCGVYVGRRLRGYPCPKSPKKADK